MSITHRSDSMEEFEIEEDQKEGKKTKSWQTVGSLVNQMMGGTMLVLPILFHSNGLIGASLNMFISGLISCKTCCIYIDHFKPKEQDYNESIMRILGKKYELLYRIAKGCYLLLLTLTYFLLITEQFYLMIIFFIGLAAGEECDPNADPKLCPYFVPVDAENQFIFNKFSMPYMSLMVLAFTLLIAFQKEMVFFIKIASYGVLTVVAFFVFIIYVFFSNIFTSEFSVAIKDQTMFSWDIGTLAGTSALAFAIQVNSATSLKCNENQANNKRDMVWVYILSGGLYILIGLLGCLGTIGNCFQEDEAATINDCFPSNDVANLIIIIIYLFNLVTAFPIYFSIMKGAFFNLFMQGQIPSQKADAIFNVVYLVICTIVLNIPGIKPDAIMALNGSVCCFFYVYVIPIMMQFKCYHGENKLMMGMKRTMSKFGLIKDDTEGAAQLKKENAEYRARFISVKNPEISRAGESGSKQSLLDESKPNVDDPYYQQQRLQRRFSQAQQSHPEIRKVSVGRVQGLASETTERDTEIQKDDDEMSGRYSFESCNDHSENEGKSMTVRIIFYSIIGMVGIFILFFELYLVVKSLF